MVGVSYADEWYETEQERLDRIKDRERVIRATRHAELQDVEGMDEFDRRQEVQQQQFDRMIVAMESCASKLTAILEDYRLVNTKKGQVFGNRFPLTTGMVTKVDLKRPEQSFNLPTGVRLDLPRKPLTDLIIINEGAGNLYFSTNDKSDKVGTYIAASDTLTLSFGQPILEFLNLYADANLTLNMIAII